MKRGGRRRSDRHGARRHFGLTYSFLDDKHIGVFSVGRAAGAAVDLINQAFAPGASHYRAHRIVEEYIDKSSAGHAVALIFFDAFFRLSVEASKFTPGGFNELTVPIAIIPDSMDLEQASMRLEREWTERGFKTSIIVCTADQAPHVYKLLRWFLTAPDGKLLDSQIPKLHAFLSLKPTRTWHCVHVPASRVFEEITSLYIQAQISTTTTIGLITGHDISALTESPEIEVLIKEAIAGAAFPWFSLDHGIQEHQKVLYPLAGNVVTVLMG